jgi:hypothetical protein
MFPIYLKHQESFSPPPEPTFFLLARNGVYLVKRSPLYEAITQFSGALPGLATQQPQLRLHLPKLPQTMLEQLVGFFLEVFQRYGTEAMAVLFYSQEGGFRVGVPWQQVRRLGDGASTAGNYHVRYQRYPRPAHCLQLGTIHSHGDQPAMHSCVDAWDEQYVDGLHIVVGDLTAPRPSFSTAFVASGQRFQLPPEMVLAGYAHPRLPAPAGWLTRITCHTDQAPAWSDDNHPPRWRSDDAATPASGPAEAD